MARHARVPREGRLPILRRPHAIGSTEGLVRRHDSRIGTGVHQGLGSRRGRADRERPRTAHPQVRVRSLSLNRYGLPVRSRWLHPGQQHGRRWPSSSSSCVRRIRRSRVIFCLAFSTQQMNSLRARGVMSFQAPRAVGLAINAIRKSAGSLCTTPPGTRGPLTETPYRLEAKPCHNRLSATTATTQLQNRREAHHEIGQHGDASLRVELSLRGSRRSDSQMTEHNE